MRTLRFSVVGSLILGLLGGVAAVTVAQSDAPTANESALLSGAMPYPNVTHPTSPILEEGRTLIREYGFGGTIDIGDPRLAGELWILYNADTFPDSRGSVAVGRAGIDNEDGAWHGTFHGYATPNEERLYYLLDFVGEGAYEGLSAMLFLLDNGRGFDVEGMIYPGELPPLPEAQTAVVPEVAVALDATIAPEAIGEPADDGARIIDVDELDERTVDLTIDSPAVGTETVRLLLPAGFDPGGDGDWPVLYLLHGALDDYTSWTRETDVSELTADLPLLVVMPAAGADGWYSDWWNGGEGGPPMWETYHLTEVRELLERNWQSGDERVVAGLSMGGFGAMSYAARHPGLFKAAASFSGVLHPLDLGFGLHPSLWGDRTEQADVWAAHDPVALADALDGIPLYVSYGNGEPGRLDEADAAFDELEAALWKMNETFVERLAELGIRARVDAYGPGTHTWPYWERSLHEAMPMLLEALDV